MRKVQTRRRENTGPQNKASPRFEIVRDGEPLPEIALRPLRKPRVRRTHLVHVAPAVQAAHCPLCDEAITRFDAEIFERHDRCGPCYDALSEIDRRRSR